MDYNSSEAKALSNNLEVSGDKAVFAVIVEAPSEWSLT